MSMKSRYLSAIGVSVAVGLTLLGGCGEDVAQTVLMEIPYVTVEAQDVSIPLDVIGETMGSTDVSIRARVEGFIDGIHFAEGTFVKKETLLYSIDPEPFLAGLAQAQGHLGDGHL